MCRSVSRCLATCRLREHRAQVFESERIGPDVSGKSDYNVVLAFERLGHGGDCLVIFIEQFFDFLDGLAWDTGVVCPPRMVRSGPAA